jgi:hypothetical protein
LLSKAFPKQQHNVVLARMHIYTIYICLQISLQGCGGFLTPATPQRSCRQ